MKKTYKMENLDCANCAAKMEAAISKLPGVEQATVNFLMQKITLVADENQLPVILEEANKCCRKIDRDCRILY